MQIKDVLILSLKKIMKIKMKKTFIVIITLLLLMGLAVDSMAVIGDGKSNKTPSKNPPNIIVRSYSRIKSFFLGRLFSPSSSTGSDRYSQYSPTSLFSTVTSNEGYGNVYESSKINFPNPYPPSILNAFLAGGVQSEFLNPFYSTLSSTSSFLTGTCPFKHYTSNKDHEKNNIQFDQQNLYHAKKNVLHGLGSNSNIVYNDVKPHTVPYVDPTLISRQNQLLFDILNNVNGTNQVVKMSPGNNYNFEHKKKSG
ncbi:hypothetical protein AGMMS49531_08760 [Endomicrobiia bacterium]|nr:hypothetical protein AGMMS49531_08760 [Endomicrobiia bacterium]